MRRAADASTRDSNELSVWVEGLVHPRTTAGPGTGDNETSQHVDPPAEGLLPLNKVHPMPWSSSPMSCLVTLPEVHELATALLAACNEVEAAPVLT
jgi:hypothetical protein